MGLVVGGRRLDHVLDVNVEDPISQQFDGLVRIRIASNVHVPGVVNHPVVRAVHQVDHPPGHGRGLAVLAEVDLGDDSCAVLGRAVAGLGNPGRHNLRLVLLKCAVLQPARAHLHHLAGHVIADRQKAFHGLQAFGALFLPLEDVAAQRRVDQRDPQMVLGRHGLDFLGPLRCAVDVQVVGPVPGRDFDAVKTDGARGLQGGLQGHSLEHPRKQAGLQPLAAARLGGQRPPQSPSCRSYGGRRLQKMTARGPGHQSILLVCNNAAQMSC